MSDDSDEVSAPFTWRRAFLLLLLFVAVGLAFAWAGVHTPNDYNAFCGIC